MSFHPRVAIVAEVGHRVGWGHVSRSVMLRRILSSEYHVTLKVVNREPWDDTLLASEFALRKPLDADIVFADGLELREEINKKARADSVVSLSYMSDINEMADLVVAPALNGMEVPDYYMTDLEALLCNRPQTTVAPVRQGGSKMTIGICMGGADVEGLGPTLEASLNEFGYRTRILANDASRRATLSQFLEDKLREHQDDPFPYYALSDCDVAVCQGGLSAIELALLGVPTVMRSRSDFAPAYKFLESLGCSLRLSSADTAELIEVIAELSEDADQRTAMVRACSELSAQICNTFWIKLVDKQVKIRTAS
jgi:spore coat polysaccharide biosynthesis predicted glycosyltransferase SpsG